MTTEMREAIGYLDSSIKNPTILSKLANLEKLTTKLLRSQKVDLTFSYFLIFIFLFLELRIRVSDDITQSHDMVTVTITSYKIYRRI